MLSPIVFLALLCAFAALTFASVKRIPEGHAYTLRRIGGHMRTLGAGTHLVLPLIERVAHKITLLGNVVEIAVQTPAGAATSLRGRVYFQVLDAQRADEVIDDMADLLRRRIPELAGNDTQEDLSARNQRLKVELNRDLRDRGLLITRVQLAPV
jgi:regulator of protease activity HflC (stomatin/prohibitin superfamily)